MQLSLSILQLVAVAYFASGVQAVGELKNQVYCVNKESRAVDNKECSGALVSGDPADIREIVVGTFPPDLPIGAKVDGGIRALANNTQARLDIGLPERGVLARDVFAHGTETLVYCVGEAKFTRIDDKECANGVDGPVNAQAILAVGKFAEDIGIDGAVLGADFTIPSTNQQVRTENRLSPTGPVSRKALVGVKKRFVVPRSRFARNVVGDSDSD